MSATLRLILTAVCCCAFLTTVDALNNTTSTGTHNVTLVQLDNETAFGVCLYPISGSYSFLNRLLYYCTLVFSLFSRAHLWLVAGALATALTYSGAAAVHACLLAWKGPNPYQDNDSWALATILGCACVITVPLLNWSGTLRRLGARFADARDKEGLHTQSHAGTRTVVIYWAFLVLIGYLSIWKSMWYYDANSTEYPDMNKVFCRAGTNASVFTSSDGTWHKRAIDQQFISSNGCNNPCDLIQVPSIFRQNSDLGLLDYREALLWDEVLTGKKYRKLNKFINIQSAFSEIHEFIIVFILLQGVFTACFGRRDPREIRDEIYIKLAMEHPISRKPVLLAIQDYFARFLAGLTYFLAVLMVIICPPLFIAIVAEREWSSAHQVPDAEPVYSVGQWGPWAIAVQVILAALISRYHDRVVGSIASGFRWIFSSCRGRQRKQKYTDVPQQSQHPSVSHLSDPESAAETKTAVNTVNSVTLDPIFNPTTTKPKQTWGQYLSSPFVNLYKSCTSPLNQNDRGLWDEIQNFGHWCKDPQRTSRKVVRHPIRPRDEQMVVDDTESAQGQLQPMRRESGFFRAASVKKPHERP